jgi:uncharacterized protein YrrD
MQIEIGARVRTSDGQEVGEVHRIVVDLDNQAVTGIVVLKGGLLSRDVLVPIDFVESAAEDEARLSLTEDELDRLPNFAYNEFLAPPPTWALAVPLLPGGAIYIPVHQRERLGPTQEDILPGAKVWATDGELGTVDRVEFDARSARLDAFWIRAEQILPHDMRIPAEWVERVEERGIYLHAARAEVERLLGAESRSRGLG